LKRKTDAVKSVAPTGAPTREPTGGENNRGYIYQVAKPGTAVSRPYDARAMAVKVGAVFREVIDSLALSNSHFWDLLAMAAHHMRGH